MTPPAEDHPTLSVDWACTHGQYRFDKSLPLQSRPAAFPRRTASNPDVPSVLMSARPLAELTEPVPLAASLRIERHLVIVSRPL